MSLTKNQRSQKLLELIKRLRMKLRKSRHQKLTRSYKGSFNLQNKSGKITMSAQLLLEMQIVVRVPWSEFSLEELLMTVEAPLGRKYSTFLMNRQTEELLLLVRKSWVLTKKCSKFKSISILTRSKISGHKSHLLQKRSSHSWISAGMRSISKPRCLVLLV